MFQVGVFAVCKMYRVVGENKKTNINFSFSTVSGFWVRSHPPTHTHTPPHLIPQISTEHLIKRLVNKSVSLLNMEVLETEDECV